MNKKSFHRLTFFYLSPLSGSPRQHWHKIVSFSFPLPFFFCLSFVGCLQCRCHIILSCWAAAAALEGANVRRETTISEYGFHQSTPRCVKRKRRKLQSSSVAIEYKVRDISLFWSVVEFHPCRRGHQKIPGSHPGERAAPS